MDHTDLKILSLLQQDATRSVAEIAEQVNLSVTPCWRRIQKLKDDGVIARNAVLLDPLALGLKLTVFVSIKTNRHDLNWLEKFALGVKDMPEVMEFYRMTGETDYLLKVVVPDIAGFDLVYKKLIQVAELFDVSSSFAMEELKYTTALPLDYL